MRKFTDKPTEQYKNAAKSIREVAEKESLDLANRAYSEGVSDLTKKDYAESRGVKPRKEMHVCVSRLQNGKKCLENPRKICLPNIPGQDHLTEWVKNGKTETITFEPYGLDFDTVKEIVRFCEEKGLEFEIRAASWHFPHSTLLVELKRKSE